MRVLLVISLAAAVVSAVPMLNARTMSLLDQFSKGSMQGNIMRMRRDVENPELMEEGGFPDITAGEEDAPTANPDPLTTAFIKALDDEEERLRNLSKEVTVAIPSEEEIAGAEALMELTGKEVADNLNEEDEEEELKSEKEKKKTEDFSKKEEFKKVSRIDSETFEKVIADAERELEATSKKPTETSTQLFDETLMSTTEIPKFQGNFSLKTDEKTLEKTVERIVQPEKKTVNRVTKVHIHDGLHQKRTPLQVITAVRKSLKESSGFRGVSHDKDRESITIDKIQEISAILTTPRSPMIREQIAVAPSAIVDQPQQAQFVLPRQPVAPVESVQKKEHQADKGFSHYKPPSSKTALEIVEIVNELKRAQNGEQKPQSFSVFTTSKQSYFILPNGKVLVVSEESKLARHKLEDENNIVDLPKVRKQREDVHRKQRKIERLADGEGARDIDSEEIVEPLPMAFVPVTPEVSSQSLLQTAHASSRQFLNSPQFIPQVVYPQLKPEDDDIIIPVTFPPVDEDLGDQSGVFVKSGVDGHSQLRLVSLRRSRTNILQ